jgi:hypothetical protein
MVVGGGLFVDLGSGNDTIRIQPFTANPIFGDFFPQLKPNSLYMLGGEISLDREGGVGNDLITIESKYYDGEYGLGLYMGSYPGFDYLYPMLVASEDSSQPATIILPPPLTELPAAPSFFFPAIGGNSLLLGAGNDTLSIKSGGSDGPGDGIIMDGEFTGDGNLIQFGAGQDLLRISASGYGLGMFGSSNYIYMGVDADTISITMSQSSNKDRVDSAGESCQCETAGIILVGGDNGIITQDGNDVIRVVGAADYAIWNTTGTILTGAGDDLIEVDNDKGYGIYMEYAGVIGTGAGNDTITSSSQDNALYLDTGSLLKTGAGDDLASFTSNNPSGYSAVRIEDASQLLMGKGNDSLIVDNRSKPGEQNNGIYLDDAGKVDMGEGDDFVNVRQVGTDDDSNGIRLGDGSAVYLGSGNDTVIIESDQDGIDLDDGGNLFDLGEGDDLLSIDNRDAREEWGLELEDSVFTAGSGDDTVTIISGGGGIEAVESTLAFGTGNNLVDIDSKSRDLDAIELEDSTLSFGEADDGAGDDTISILSNSAGGIDLETSSITLGAGDNLIEVQSNQVGVNLEDGSNIVFGEGNDTLKVFSQANGFSGVQLSEGSSIHMGDGSNLVDVSSNGGDAIEIKDYSKLLTGTGSDTILAFGDETSDPSGKDAGIEISDYSGLFTSDGDDLIEASATYGIQVYENSGIDTGFGLDTIIATGNLEAGILLNDSSINTGNNFDLIVASSTGDYSLRTGKSDDLSFASVNTGRGADTVSLLDGWYTNGGGSINLGAGQDLLLLNSYDVEGDLKLPGFGKYLDEVTSNGGAAAAAAYVNFGRGADDTLRLGVGKYSVVYLPDVFEGLYGIIDADFDILAVTNLEFIGGIGSFGEIDKATTAFPTSVGSVASFQINGDGTITT